MDMLLEYINAIKNDAAKRAKFDGIMCEAMMHLKDCCPLQFKEYMYKIHETAFGNHFNESLAKAAVAKMKNVDGSSGEHWSYTDATTLAARHGVKNVADFYYVLNMFWSDFAEVLNTKDATAYAKMAAAYINDPDADDGKPFRLWLAQHEW